MKIIGVTVGTTTPKPNFDQTDPRKGDFIKGDRSFLRVDDTLTESGISADARAVGEAINAVIKDVDELSNQKADVGHNHNEAYDTKGAADTALASAKTYADSAAAKVKDDLLNGAGAAYDTLKELGDLIDDNQDAIEALETVATGKADASALTSHTDNKSNPHGVTASQISAVPTSRTVNGKALSANITLSASDVGADESGAASTALTNAKAYTDAEITEWVGDKTVAEQISAAIADSFGTSHDHDDKYYTKTQIDNMELITVGDIDTICGTTIQMASEVTF